MDPLFHWLVVVVTVLVLIAGRKIPELFGNLGNGPRNGPTIHPLPVSSLIESSRPSENAEKPWQL
jgi:hypothetical protein